MATTAQRTGPPRPSRLAVRGVTVAVAVVASAYVTILSFYGPTQVALAAPLAGVVMVVALTSTLRSLPLDAAVVAVCAFGAITVQVSDWRLGAVGAITSLIQGAAVLGTYRALGRWPGAGRRGLRSLTDVPALALAVLAAALTSSLARWSGIALIEPSDLSNVVLTTVRTITWGFVLGAVGLMLAAGERPLGRAENRRRGAAGVVEGAAGLAITVAILAVAFPRTEPLPVIFPIFLVVVWASLRLCPVTAVALSGSIGVFAVACTVLEFGSFAEVADPRVGAALAQSFLLCLVVLALTLSLSVRDRERSAEALRDAIRDTRRRARERDLVLGNLAEGVVLFEHDGRILLRNDAGRRIFGRSALPPPEVSPDPAELGLRHLDGTPVPHDFIAELVASATRTPYEVTLVVHPPDQGPPRTIETRTVRAGSVEGDDGAEDLVVATFRDVTEAHERTAELAAFAGVVAHDLARPLTLITGWAELLESSGTEGLPLAESSVRQFSTRILGAAESMRSLLDDLLTLTLARDRELRVTEVDVTGLCQAWATTHLTADVATSAQVDVQPGIVVCGDETLLRQVFDNLLANAVKYVAPEVTPRVTVTAQGSASDRLRIRVTDNGIGIPAGETSRVFDEFYRSSRGRQDYQGTGIGLAICRRVVERHDGTIRATSAPGGSGTVFELELPRVVPATTPTPTTGETAPGRA